MGARRRCSSSAPGHCQSQLEGFEGTGIDYAGVKLVPGDYGSWEKRLFVLFGVIAWNFKAAVMVSGLVKDWILDNVVWAVWRTDVSAGFLGG